MGQLFVLGFVTGFLTSIGIGPLTLTAVSRSICNGTKAGVAVGVGAATMDVIVVILLGRGLLTLKIPDTIITSMALVVGAGLIVGGLRKFAKSSSERFRELHMTIENPYPQSQERMATHSAVGVLLYVLNPLFLVLWASILSLLGRRGLLVGDLPSLLMFAIAAGAGTLSLFWLLSSGVRRLGSRLGLLQRATALVPVIEIAIGIIVVVQSSFLAGYNIKLW